MRSGVPLADVVHRRGLAQQRREGVRLAEPQCQSLGQEGDAHDVDAGLVVAVVGGQREAHQHVVVRARDLLQRLVALLDHLAEVVEQALHLRQRRRAELHRLGGRHAGSSIVLSSCSGLNGLSRYASAPAARPFSMSWLWPRALSRMMRVAANAGSARSRRQASSPS